MKIKKYPKMTLRQKKIEPLINKSLEIIGTSCEQFVKANSLKDANFKIAGRVQNAACDLPMKLSFYYDEYNDAVRVDFDVDYVEAKDEALLKHSLEKLFNLLLLGIKEAQKLHVAPVVPQPAEISSDGTIK